MRTALLVLALMPAAANAATGDWARLPGGEFRSALRYEDTGGTVRVAPFEMQRQPVSNAEFAAFVRANPEWQRGQAPEVFAEARYLQNWQSATEPGAKALPDWYPQSLGIAPQTVSHEEFKRRSATARAIVRTGECTPYANIMLIAGVSF